MIEDGYASPTKIVDDKKVPKPRSKWDGKDFALAILNFKAINYYKWINL